MDELDSRVYYGYKDSLRKAVDYLSKREITYYWEMPVILIDYWAWEVFLFKSEGEARMHLEKHNTDWDDSPPEGEEEELVVMKFCTESLKNKFAHTFKDYEFFKEVNGTRIYRKRGFVYFEPELVINVSI